MSPMRPAEGAQATAAATRPNPHAAPQVGGLVRAGWASMVPSVHPATLRAAATAPCCIIGPLVCYALQQLPKRVCVSRRGPFFSPARSWTGGPSSAHSRAVPSAPVSLPPCWNSRQGIHMTRGCVWRLAGPSSGIKGRTGGPQLSSLRRGPARHRLQPAWAARASLPAERKVAAETLAARRRSAAQGASLCGLARAAGPTPRLRPRPRAPPSLRRRPCHAQQALHDGTPYKSYPELCFKVNQTCSNFAYGNTNVVTHIRTLIDNKWVNYICVAALREQQSLLPECGSIGSLPRLHLLGGRSRRPLCQTTGTSVKYSSPGSNIIVYPESVTKLGRVLC